MVKIISNSTCDLSPELIAKYDIDILPLHILLGRTNMKMAETLRRSRSMTGLMHTKQRPKHQPRLWLKPLIFFAHI